MYRTAIEKLQAWKQRKNHKPLIIRGARQVGKTWLMQEFGKDSYQEVVYINFDNNQIMKDLFSGDLNIERIILGLELYSNKQINSENTLLIFDEIQEVPAALTSLKYFNETAPQYDILCAGSLLGVALHEGTSFPVGKVEFLDLHPLSFKEFMMALDKERFAELIAKNELELANSFKLQYADLLKQYYFIGGMPEAVQVFIDQHDYDQVRAVQQRILDAYEQDFSKHAPSAIVPRLRMLWNSIPSQLAKENKKFVYGLVKEGARAKDYELALLWLADCGLVHKIHRISKPCLPLKAYEDLKAFKLFVLDVGLLSCMARLQKKALLEGDNLFQEFKGALTEQYVLQQLKALDDLGIYYWTSDRGIAEIDFVIDCKGNIVPIEVKAEVNLKAKSLRVYRDAFNPQLSVRMSLANYKDEGWLVNLPLWATEAICAIEKSRTA